jgi:hypothetical protein
VIPKAGRAWSGLCFYLRRRKREQDEETHAAPSLGGSGNGADAQNNFGERVMTSRMRFALPLGVVLAAACGSSEVPAKQLAESQSAVRAASEVGADHNPQAALHLKMARDQIAKAQALSREGEQEAAEQLLKQAEADAELALALTRAEQAQTGAERAEQQLESLPQ